MNVSRHSRRNFLKTAGVVSAGIAAGSLSMARCANAAGSDIIKVALIGCGGRGMGSLLDRFAVGDAVKVVAVADLAKGIAERAATALAKMEDKKEMIALNPDCVFGGFYSYKKAMEFADLVLIASPPAFHPDHYLYAVEQGKHVFMEKPFGIDAEGYRRCMKANEIAQEKGLTVCAGFQRRHEKKYLEWISRIHDGEIGDILSTSVYWNCGGAKVRGAREEGESEMSFQLRDWYFFNWLSGDHIIEQHCHNIDVGNWIHGKGNPLAHPVSCVGMGGRQVRRTPRFSYNECGNIFDHHYVEYQYVDDTVMHSQCRQIPGCWNSITEKVVGTKGIGQIGWLQPKEGKKWEYPKNNKTKGRMSLDCYVPGLYDDFDFRDFFRTWRGLLIRGYLCRRRLITRGSQRSGRSGTIKPLKYFNTADNFSKRMFDNTHNVPAANKNAHVCVKLKRRGKTPPNAAASHITLRTRL